MNQHFGFATIRNICNESQQFATIIRNKHYNAQCNELNAQGFIALLNIQLLNIVAKYCLKAAKYSINSS